MKKMATATALGVTLLGVGTGLMACGGTPSATAPSPTAHPASTAAAPGATKTVIRYKTAPASSPAASGSSGPPGASGAEVPAPGAATSPAAPQQPGDQNVTDPWAVVSAYYGDIESGNYAQAYALIGYGATTGQSYQEFAAGFTCTGSQGVSENWESGNRVNFDLAAADRCTGETQYYTGTDTVENGTIVAADITQAG
jgi:hypothetical protein